MGDSRMGWGREGGLKSKVSDRWNGIGEVGERLLAGGIYRTLDTTLLSLQMSHRSLEDREEKEELKELSKEKHFSVVNGPLFLISCAQTVHFNICTSNLIEEI